MSPPQSMPRLRIRIAFEDGSVLGPGKADLMEAIARTGSISAAGRHMGMSYKRAWMLVEALNAMFREPLVASTRGGSAGGGASLTPLGEAVLADYRAIERATAESGAEEIRRLVAARPDMSPDIFKEK